MNIALSFVLGFAFLLVIMLLALIYDQAKEINESITNIWNDPKRPLNKPKNIEYR